MSRVDDYRAIVGDEEVDELYLLAERLKGKSVQNINSTATGGGVAEILSRMVPLLRDLGIDAHWDVIKGNEKFFTVTKEMHNALHGLNVEVSKDDLEYFLEVNRQNQEEMDLFGDIVFIHDPQPIGLVEKREHNGNKWIWRCHIDISEPQKATMDFLRGFIDRYDAAVFSAPSFARSDIAAKQILISPSIDPLSEKNRELPQGVIDSVTERYCLDRNRPIVTQISRFDYFKDPLGVIEVYKKVKDHIDCQLVLAGGGATDDPEGPQVLDQIRSAVQSDPDIHIIYLPPSSDLEVNALQRASTVVLQKSLREGFGLTVAEALWKAKPVIATATGGIPLQIEHRHSGILAYSTAGMAHYLMELLSEPEYAAKLGMNGREHIRNNFLITRHIKDYLCLFISLYHKEDMVYL
ncbi:MAG TPA: glycosyltransferase [Methanothrix sp.]|nr:glycosyltransferase [Methanothrix sp.]HQE86846.1 glycosyltransferase [Methanothrix sp.]HQI67542.1 glycosyltransferase [Methanothrix sp.]HRS85286.1 glycosyltransferase [Methanothrix sp.]HRT16223.1 glycosyltransferase [Methanothrix sp.]